MLRGCARSDLNDCVGELKHQKKPGRANLLFKKAIRMGTLIVRGDIEQTEVADALYEACVCNGLVAENGEHDVRRQIAKGFKTKAPKKSDEGAKRKNQELRSAVAEIGKPENSELARATSSGDVELDAELKRLAGLPPALYEHEREPVAEKFKIRKPVLDRLVDAIRVRESDNRQGHALKLFEPEPWPRAVNGSELLDKLVSTLRRYVIMSEDEAIAVALWILHSYVYDAFMCTPRLCVSSPEKRCGKTTLLDVIGCLVNRPLLTANITSAALFRTVELAQPTVLFDEADNAFGRNGSANGSGNDILAVLNSGHRLGGSVTRTVGDDHVPRTFKTHTPVVIALIGKAPGTLDDRSVHVRLRRKHAGEVVERFRMDRTEELLWLARQASRWANDYRSKLSECDPEMPPGLFNRAADNWRPLVAIADTIGGEWAMRARAVAVKSAEAEKDEGRRIMLLTDIRASFETRKVDRLPSDQIVADLTALEGRPWPDFRHGDPINKHQLARLLEHFEIRPKVINFGRDHRTGKDVTARGYLLSMFDDAFARYLQP